MLIFSFEFAKGKYIVNNLNLNEISFNDFDNAYYLSQNNVGPMIEQIYNLDYLKDLTIVTFDNKNKVIGLFDFPLELSNIISNLSFGDSRYFRSFDFLEVNDFYIRLNSELGEICISQSDNEISCIDPTSKIYRSSFEKVVPLYKLSRLGNEVQINTENEDSFNKFNQFMVDNGYTYDSNKTIDINYISMLKYSLSYSKTFHINISILSSIILIGFSFLYFYYSNGKKISQFVFNGATMKSIWTNFNKKILVLSLVLISLLTISLNFSNYLKNINFYNLIFIGLVYFILICGLSLISLIVYWKQTSGDLKYEE